MESMVIFLNLGVQTSRIANLTCGGLRRGHRGGKLGSSCRDGLTIDKKRTIVEAVKSSDPKTGDKKQCFVEPVWLYPTSDYLHRKKITTRETKETATSGSEGLDLAAIYLVTLCTSMEDRSSLSEPNAEILISIIGENGRAMLHKIPAVDSLASDEGSVGQTSYRFKRGDMDVSCFSGPHLGRLAALWIAPDAGTWKVGQVSITVVPVDKQWKEFQSDSASLTVRDFTELVKNVDDTEDKERKVAVIHTFHGGGALVGDGAHLGAAELKPSSVHECSSGKEVVEKLSQLTKPVEGRSRLREQGLNEYEKLKLSSLAITSSLVVAGTACFAALGWEQMVKGYAFGGFGGLFYLLILQNTVDQLPSASSDQTLIEVRKASLLEPESTPGLSEREGNGRSRDDSNQTLPNKVASIRDKENVNTSLRVLLAAGTAILFAKLVQEDAATNSVSPQEVLAGVLGFLTCKVAVVLAALKPPPTSDE